MKKGKTQKISGFKNFKVSYGTVDFKNLKSLYINIQSWALPKTDIEKTNRVVSLLNREIKHIVLDSIDKEYFKNNFIVDLDLRHSGISFGKKSFLNLEITLFSNSIFDFKDQKLKRKIEDIVKTLYSSSFLNNEYFSFELTKK